MKKSKRKRFLLFCLILGIALGVVLAGIEKNTSSDANGVRQEQSEGEDAGPNITVESADGEGEGVAEEYILR